MIERRLQELTLDENYRKRIREVHMAKQGIANHFVSWAVLTEELLEFALCRIPNQPVIHMFRRMLRDLRNNRSGFPDLVSFPDRGGYELIEVKGPGDQLQLNQKRWIKAFNEYQVPFSLARVEWANDQRT